MPRAFFTVPWEMESQLFHYFERLGFRYVLER